jgi:hypothetical protein
MKYLVTAMRIVPLTDQSALGNLADRMRGAAGGAPALRWVATSSPRDPAVTSGGHRTGTPADGPARPSGR